MKWFFLLFANLTFCSFGQTVINVYTDSLEGNVGTKYQPGVFYVPKTNEAQVDFLGNGIQQNSIRLNIVEGALNNTTNLADCIAYLDGISGILQDLSNKTEKLLFIFEKMPVWLSSSSDGSPAMTPGWFVLNTKPPASYTDWNLMVTSIVDRIINNYGIDNAAFEVWNEPDLGSWTGSKVEFFELFQHTYDAIKQVDTSIPVGGPATNHWAKNIGYQHPYGYINDSIGNLSLIGELIDSTYAWNKPLDFLSWHNFNLEYQTNQNAIDYINQKCTLLGIATPELMVSEWNTPSVVRDTPMQRSFFAKSQMEMAKTNISYNMVAAWQDFSQSANEFHNDYGLLTYGSIHKPAYNALQLSDMLSGTIVKTSANLPVDLVASVSGDTLSVLISNYTPPAFIEAFNHTLYEGQFNAEQLEAAGYIDISTNNLSHLDSIYQGLIVISSTNSINTAINNSIPVYDHFDSIENTDRQFYLNVIDFLSNYNGVSYSIDSSKNNGQFTYDSLLIQGLTQADAIANVTSNQSLEDENVNLVNGEISFGMEPNSVRFFQFVIPGLVGLQGIAHDFIVSIWPNPVMDYIEIQSGSTIGRVNVVDLHGKILANYILDGNSTEIDMSNYRSGCYLFQFLDHARTIRVLKQ